MVEQVVGLQFVTQGAEKATRDMTEYSRGTMAVSKEASNAAKILNTKIGKLFDAAAAYEKNTRNITKLNAIMAQNAREAQAVVNAATGVTNAYTSAEASAAIFARELAAGEAVMRRQGRAFNEAVREANGLNREFLSAADSASVFEQEMRKQDAAIERLSVKYKPLYAASRQYENALNEINQAHQLGVLSTKQHEDAVERLNLEYQQFQNGTAGWSNQFVQGGQRSARSVNRFGMVAQQVGYQVGDFFVQIQSGTNAFVAFGQQATQLAGLLPGVLGAVVGIGISVGTMFLSMWDRSRQAKDGVDDLKEAMDSLKNSSKNLEAELAQMRFGVGSAELATALVQQEILTKKLAEAQLEYSEALQKSVENEASLAAAGEAGRAARRLREAEQNLRAVETEIERQRQLAEEVRKRKSDEEWMLRNRQNQLEAALEYFDAFVAGQQDAMNNTVFLNANLGQMARTVSRTADEAVRLRDALAAAGRASLGRTDQIAVLQAQIAAARRGASVSGAAAGAETAISLGRAGATADQIAAAAMKAAGEAETIDKLQKTLSDLTRTDSSKGGGGSNVININEIIAARQEQIAQERILMGLTGRRRIEEEVYFDLLKQNRDANVQMSDQQLRAAAQAIAAEQQVNEVMQERKQVQEQLAQTIESSMESAFMSIVDGTKSAKDAFRDMARSIISELYRVLVVQRLVGAISGSIGGLGSLFSGPAPGSTASILGTVSAHANGNAFSGGNVIPFANGGVVGGPTTFPMSGGRTGLMGEAGPEAIMPLKRTANGKLGVVAEGGSGISIVQNINVQGDNAAAVRAEVAKLMPTITQATKTAVIDARRRGGQMKAAFG